MTTGQPPYPGIHGSGEIQTMVESVLDKIQAYYIFPDTATLMAQALRTHLEVGEYDQVATLQVLCDLLTSHLQAVSHDKQVSVSYSSNPLPSELEDQPPTPEDIRIFRLQGSIRNFGFEKVARLAGNIGYLDLRTLSATVVSIGHILTGQQCLHQCETAC